MARICKTKKNFPNGGEKMKETRKNKLKNKKGFTLMEMLVCVLTLTLLGMICTTGSNLAVKSYQNLSFETDSQMLESTLNMRLEEILREVTTVSGSAVTGGTPYPIAVSELTHKGYQIFSGNIEIKSINEAGEEDPTNGKGRVVVYRKPLTVISDNEPILLLNTNTYTDTLYITPTEGKDFITYNYNEGNSYFEITYTIKSILSDDYIHTCNFVCGTNAEKE